MLKVIGVDYPLSLLVIAGGSAVLAFAGAFCGIIYRGIDRKLVARMQGRIGPPIVQPMRDIQKLMMKENIVPDGALPWLFNAAPLLAMISSILLLLYIPLFGQQALLGGYGDAILVLYLTILPSLALVLGGFASSSPYATIGAQREMVIMMSYEFPLAAALVSVAWRVGLATGANPFLFSTLAQYPIWNLLGPLGILGALFLLFTLLIVTTAEISKVPFDIAEAETELAGGILVEYSGRNYGLFYLADLIKGFAMVSLIVALFFPYNLSPAFGINIVPLAYLVDAVFFLAKVFVVMFLSIMFVRTAVARFKISQASTIYIGGMTAIALVGLALIWVDRLVV